MESKIINGVEYRSLSIIYPYVPGYWVGANGIIISSKNIDRNPSKYQEYKALKPYTNNCGYLIATFSIPGGGLLKESVHRLVNLLWNRGRYSPALETDHLDGDKLNNHFSNLRWVTRQENVSRATRRIFFFESLSQDGEKAFIWIKNLHHFCKREQIDYKKMTRLAAGLVDSCGSFKKASINDVKNFIKQARIKQQKISKHYLNGT